jgi:hypothetical protein
LNGFDEQTLAKLGYVRQSDGSYRKGAPLVAGLCPAVAEPRPVPSLASCQEDEGRSAGRRHVCITVATCRLRDADNTVVKWLVDSLRYHGIIADDDPGSITLEVRQVKVGSKKFQGTLIEVDLHEPKA